MTDPILISPAAHPARTRPKRSKTDIAAMAAMIIGGALTATSIMAFLGFALYPLFDGQGLREFLVSLIVPLLISLMGIVPGLLLYGTGRKVRRDGPGYGSAAIALCLALPPLVFAIDLLPRLGSENIAARVITGLIGAALLLWAASLFVTRRRAAKGPLT